MQVKTKHFGEVDLDENKIIHFEGGILGFEEYKDYTILFDNEDGVQPNISWLQSIDEPSLSIPVISPFLIKEDYNPEIEDEFLKSLDKLTDANLVVMVSITVPSDVSKISANLKAPFILNSDSRKGVQVIVENSDYEVKNYFYDKLDSIKTKKGVDVC
jgi:flagellar assembly factor FliW